MKFLAESEKELSEDVILLKKMYAEIFEKSVDLRREFNSKMKSAKKKDANLLNYMINLMPKEQSDLIDVESIINELMSNKTIDVNKIRQIRDLFLKLIINLDKVTISFLKKPNWTVSEQLSLYLHILDGIDSSEQVQNLKELKRLSRHRKEHVQQSSSVDGLVKARVLCTFFVKWLTIAENEFTDRQLEQSLEMQQKFLSTLKRTLTSLKNANSQLLHETKYEVRIEIFRELIKTSKEESLFQEFFEKNPDFIDRQVTKVIPQKSFGGEQIPDLILVLSNGNYIIVELKKPAFRLFTHKGDPTQELSHAEQQIRDYIDWANEEKDFLRKRGLANMSSGNTTGLVIIGGALSREEKRKLESLNDTTRNSYVVKTFREILKENEACLLNLRNNPLKQTN